MDMRPEDICRIVVVKLRTLGDVLTVFPLLRALRERFSRARLTLVADEAYRELFEPNPRVDEFWGHPAKTVRHQSLWDALRQQLHTAAQLRAQHADLYIDLYGSLRTALWGWLAGIPRRVGFNLRGRKYFYTHRITARHRFVVDLNLQFAEELGWQGTDRSLEFFVTPADESQAKKVLSGQGWMEGQPYLVISPGGGWPLKLWNPERFGQVAARVAQATGCQVVVTGSHAELPLIEACAKGLGRRALVLVGLPLRQLAAVIKGSRLFLGNDSGPKYLAGAFRVPAVICYGPTNPLDSNPPYPEQAVAFHEIDCRPCHLHACRREHRICLDDLTVAEVAEKALELWRLGAAPRGANPR